MILVCGETLVDLVPAETTDRSEGAGRAEGDQERVEVLPGGGPANTAVALARLGQPVELLTRIGRDAYGELVFEYLGRNGVGLGRVVRGAEPTTVARVSVGVGGEASYRFSLEGTASWSWWAEDLSGAIGGDVEAVHTGSMVLASPSSRELVLGLIEREQGDRTISLDPNVRLGWSGDPGGYRGAVERAVALSHLVRTSEEDLGALYPSVDPEEVARHWAGLGPRLVVVSCGPAAPIAFLGGERILGPVRSIAVVDTIAAGDTFCAALLDWLSRSGTLGRRLEGLEASMVGGALGFATAAAGITCSRRGADPPTAAEVEALLGLRRSTGPAV